MDAAYDPAFVLDISKIGLVTNTQTTSQPNSPSSFPVFSKSDSAASSSASAKALKQPIDWEFYVVLLTGERFAFQWKDYRSLQMLKRALEKMANVEPSKQKLIFQGTTLDSFKEDSLENYGIGPGSCIQFIVILYSINPTIQNITLYLDWIFPISGKDFLDGTCLVYRENSEVLVYDYQHQYRPPFPYVEHSGDKMNNNGNQGRHEISVDIENLPQDVLQLYFVLSSYGSPTIKHFRNPSFQMFDKTRPDELLCQYRIADAGNSQAVVLACVSRCDQGWQATAIGRLSSGNVDDYEPIMCTIDALRHLV